MMWCISAFVMPFILTLVMSIDVEIDQRIFLNKLHYRSSWNTTGGNFLYINSDELLTATSSRIKILLIGDSLERRAAEAFGKQMGHEYSRVGFRVLNYKCYDRNKHGRGKDIAGVENSYYGNRSSEHQVMQIFFIGALRDGDCILTRVRDTQLYRNSLLFVPDLIVLKSFYWDMTHICERVGNHCTDEDPFVYLEFIEHYYNAMSRIISELQSIFPKSQIALKTDPLWNTHHNRFILDPSTGLSLNVSDISAALQQVHRFGIRLNNVIRILASEKNLPLFDFYRIFEPLNPEQYLFDDIHLYDNYSMICMNAYFGFVNVSKK